MNRVEIINRGNEALIRELGIEGMIEYIQSFGLGYGDYTKDRKRWLKDKGIEELVKEIEIFKKIKHPDSQGSQ
jgi:hypothetical protein